MATDYETFITLVHYKGKVAQVWMKTADGRSMPWVKPVGNRRGRQIAKRHWLRKELDGFCSGSGGWRRVTIKPPGKPAQNLERPR